MDRYVSSAPRIERVRHEVQRRALTVARVEHFAPRMVRVVLRGEAMRGFTSLGFDDHIKLFFPGGNDDGSPAMRDFTPRRYDPVAGELWIEFFLHAAGPAASWASQVAVGQSLEIGGPRGSAVISPEGIDGHVLIGDETALPAIGRRLQELPVNAQVLVVGEVDAAAQWSSLEGPPATRVVWVTRNVTGTAGAEELITALRSIEFPAGQCFFWIGVESKAARAIRNYLRTERGIEKQWIKAAGYWQRGAAGMHDSIKDEE
jgi:NADPH-dependent ferric siderophore reductase